jgi:hypothetical protein
VYLHIHKQRIEDALMANRAPHCQRHRWTSKYDRRTTSELYSKNHIAEICTKLAGD